MIRLKGAEGIRPASAIVLDKDGVLVDFGPLWCAMAHQRARAIASHSGLPTDELLAMMGLPGLEIDPTGPLAMGSRAEQIAIAAFFLYQRGVNWLEAKEIAERSFEEADSAVDPAQYVRPTGALSPALEALASLGIKLAVATTDTTANAERDLRLLGIERFVGTVLGADQVERNKPHPDLFLQACRRLGVHPEDAWMVGDGLNDLRMAKRAGAGAAIGVTSGVTPRAALEREADRVLAGIWALPGAIEPIERPQPEIVPGAWYVLYTDGASRGNPGPAGIGAVLKDPQGQVLVEVSERLGIASNNFAEYRALLSGLEAARALGVRRLVVKADSELMIKQLKGDYAVKSDLLRPLHQEAIRTLHSFEGFRLIHVRREHNREADMLANRALD